MFGDMLKNSHMRWLVENLKPRVNKCYKFRRGMFYQPQKLMALSYFPSQSLELLHDVLAALYNISWLVLEKEL